jgi:N-formylglutamate deformylase
VGTLTGSFTFMAGDGPLLISMPHAGTAIPDAMADRMTPEGRARLDTDWHLDRLYDFAAELSLPVLRAVWSRYVVDLNRPPDDAPLYPGQAGTGLVPDTTFDGDPLYRPGAAPDETETGTRVDT